LPKLSTQQLNIFAICCLGLFIAIGFNLYLTQGHLVQTQDFKYPPSIYFFSYSLFVTSVLWRYSTRIETMLVSTMLYKPVLFIAQNSIWIYLWHIPLVKLLNPNIVFLTKYLVIFSFAVAITYVQYKVVHSALLANRSDDKTKRLIKTLLTG
jgi:hypothetical protein